MKPPGHCDLVMEFLGSAILRPIT